MKKFQIWRDCCTSGNCFDCRKTPFGKTTQVMQGDRDTREEAEKIVKNWSELNAFLKIKEK